MYIFIYDALFIYDAFKVILLINRDPLISYIIKKFFVNLFLLHCILLRHWERMEYYLSSTTRNQSAHPAEQLSLQVNSSTLYICINPAEQLYLQVNGSTPYIWINLAE